MKKLFSLTLAFFLSMLIFSCGKSTLEDYREEGRSVTKELIQELKKIRNKDQLLVSAAKLQKLFDQMVDVMIAAQNQKLELHKQEGLELTKEDHDLSDSLRFELNRVYNIEGGKAIIEKTQEKALNRLENYEKSAK